MDPITAVILSATLVPLASGAAGEAGKQAWATMASYVKTRFGRGSRAEIAVIALDHDPDLISHGEVLAEILESSAADDEQAAAWIRNWLRQAAPLAGQRFDQGSGATNVVTGNAQVQTLVQGQNFSNLTIGYPPPSSS
jgi:hypothetical protein